MPAKRTDPSTHAYSRQPGTYVRSGHDASHLAAVFAAERSRLAAEAAKTKRRRKPRAADPQPEENPAQLRLVG